MPGWEACQGEEYARVRHTNTSGQSMPWWEAYPCGKNARVGNMPGWDIPTSMSKACPSPQRAPSASSRWKQLSQGAWHAQMCYICPGRCLLQQSSKTSSRFEPTAGTPPPKANADAPRHCQHGTWSLHYRLACVTRVKRVQQQHRRLTCVGWARGVTIASAVVDQQDEQHAG